MCLLKSHYILTLHLSLYEVDALNEGYLKQTKFVLSGYLVM